MAIERTLVQIRARPLLDLLDLSLVVVRKRPFTLGLAALVGIAPFYAFNWWFFQNCPPDGAWFFSLTCWMVEAPFAMAPLALVIGGLMFGQKPGPFKIGVGLLKSSFSLLLIHGVLRYILIFFVPTRLAFANPIILLERGKWWKVLGRGSDLANGRGSDLIWLWLIQVIVTVAFTFVFFIGEARITQAFLAEKLTFEPPDESSLTSWRIQVPIWIVTAFFAIVRFLTYIDQRIRLEGWEVELRLREVGQAMEEARRW